MVTNPALDKWIARHRIYLDSVDEGDLRPLVLREIVRVVMEHSAAHIADPNDMLALIDAANPFASLSIRTHSRQQLAYRRGVWNKQRAIIALVLRQFETPATADEYAVWLVAHDLNELPDPKRAAKLLADQAPFVLQRKCRACDAKPGSPCSTLRGVDLTPPWRTPNVASPLVVPHESRVVPDLQRFMQPALFVDAATTPKGAR